MKDTPESWPKVEALLAQALEWPEVERAQRLRAASAGDLALEQRVSELLAAHIADGNFLAAPARVSAVPAEALPAGTRLGVWQLGEVIGHGGMGEVYAASRADGVVEQQAALKVLKRGLDTDGLVRRFLRERSILARLSHPGIARLLDAGATPDGRPYLVMERVSGVPLDQWCRQNSLDVPAILRLLRAVCDAVQAAHRSLIVHRDLKPSNVLVTAQGEAKLLDFGIAKLLDQAEDAPDATRLTLEGLPMTPSFAAPEQIRGEPVTTAADIYALGAMLFLLLTRRLPHARGGLSIAAAAQALERETTRAPSAALSSGEWTDEERRRRARQLGGDLDRIVLKALHPEPERRYASAQAFGEDLGRFLAHEPVSAAPDSAGYRVRKFVRRHRAAVAAASLSLAAIVAGAGVALWQAHEAGIQRDYARREGQSNEAARDTARRLLGYAMEKIGDDEFLPTAVAALSAVDGVTAAEIKDLNYTAALLATDANNDRVAEPLLRKALSLPADSIDANALFVLASLLIRKSEFQEAREAIEKSQALHVLQGDDHRYDWLLGERMRARIIGAAGDTTTAISVLQAALGEFVEHFGDQDSEVAVFQGQLGTLYGRANNMLRAYEMADQAISGLERAGQGRSSSALVEMGNRAQRAVRLGRLRLGEQQARQVIDLQRQLNGESALLAIAMTHLGTSLTAQGRFEEALKVEQEALDIYLRKGGPVPARTTRLALMRTQLAMGDAQQAQTGAERLLEEIGSSVVPTNALMLNLNETRGAAQLDLGDAAGAEVTLAEVLKQAEAAGDSGLAVRSRALLGLARSQRLQGRAVAAVAKGEAALKMRAPPLMDATSWERYEAQAELALCRIANGEAQGQTALAEALAGLKQQLGEAHPLVKRYAA